MNFRIEARVLAAVAMVSNHNASPSRSNLDGVHFDVSAEGEVVAVGVPGNTASLIVVRSEVEDNGLEGTGDIPEGVMKISQGDARKLGGRRFNRAVADIKFFDDHWKAEIDGDAFFGKINKGRYPNWRRMFKGLCVEDGAVRPSGFDSEMLKRLSFAYRILNGFRPSPGGTPAITPTREGHWIAGAHHEYRKWIMEINENAFAIIMPYRGVRIEKIPEWLS